MRTRTLKDHWHLPKSNFEKRLDQVAESIRGWFQKLRRYDSRAIARKMLWAFLFVYVLWWLVILSLAWNGGLTKQAKEYSHEFAQFFFPVVFCTACLAFAPQKRLDRDHRQMPEKKPEPDRPIDRPPELIRAALNFIITLAIFLAVAIWSQGHKYGEGAALALAVGMWRSARALWASVRARSWF